MFAVMLTLGRRTISQRHSSMREHLCPPLENSGLSQTLFTSAQYKADQLPVSFIHFPSLQTTWPLMVYT